ncbi:KTSC domain-containing protein [Brenneria goodwinii]|uniref:KTSC domain-containing protein n=1 Tax=Brenneria goodwinii TaxID=1109412 RepID=A0A0G4K252_9GAMM|nr:KTSC domain-containing protein [Brenneria goodwinii]MCG8158091.1 KTSC domain-containing protein [Brenneria goodwinii]MCG8162432.1 KTSC domain-containing protein [Brenneria goodwinii]MCG8167142.1 KTSC domain-containing protein [Brenneria goodwinii]MCG8171802.1 KTSC domain-containing protein [Brenneria goodwinii]MCG8176566.1 KTSC domain-containing protein [Brenneria goodwinii]
MQRQSVSSSRIRSVGYDPETHILEIEFHNKDIYQYIGVPKRIYGKFISESVISKGRFFDGVIKDKFLCRKIKKP